MGKVQDVNHIGWSEAVQLFRGRSKAASVLALFGALVLSTVLYLALLRSNGGLELAASNEVSAIEARKSALTLTGIFLGTYLGTCYTRALGGPFINVVTYPLWFVGLPVFVGLAFGTLPELTVVGSREPGFMREALSISVPGMVCLVGILVVWSRFLSWRGDAGEQWARRHMPPAYRSPDDDDVG